MVPCGLIASYGGMKLAFAIIALAVLLGFAWIESERSPLAALIVVIVGILLFGKNLADIARWIGECFPPWSPKS
jgi:hypothetical protein